MDRTRHAKHGLIAGNGCISRLQTTVVNSKAAWLIQWESTRQRGIKTDTKSVREDGGVHWSGQDESCRNLNQKSEEKFDTPGPKDMMKMHQSIEQADARQRQAIKKVQWEQHEEGLDSSEHSAAGRTEGEDFPMYVFLLQIFPRLE